MDELELEEWYSMVDAYEDEILAQVDFDLYCEEVWMFN